MDWLPLDDDIGQARHWAFACYLTGSLPFESNCIDCTTPQHGCTSEVREERQSKIWNDICELYCGPISPTSTTTNRLLALITARARPTRYSTPAATSFKGTTHTSDRTSSTHRVNILSDTLVLPASDWGHDGRADVSTIPVAAQVILVALVAIFFTIPIVLLFAFCLLSCLRKKRPRAIEHKRSHTTSETKSTHPLIEV